MQSFSERLMTLRKDLKLTQKALGEAVGLTTRMIQYYESGEKRPDLDNLVNLSTFFGVSIDYLAGKTDGPVAPRREPDSAESEFRRWVKENVSATFFFDFDSSSKEAKAQLMRDLRYMWEREKKKGK